MYVVSRLASTEIINYKSAAHGRSFWSNTGRKLWVDEKVHYYGTHVTDKIGWHQAGAV